MKLSLFFSLSLFSAVAVAEAVTASAQPPPTSSESPQEGVTASFHLPFFDVSRSEVFHVLVDPSDVPGSASRFPPNVPLASSLAILSHSLSSRAPHSQRLDACSSSPLWSSIPSSATNAFKVAGGHRTPQSQDPSHPDWRPARVTNWRGDTERLRTVHDMHDLVLLANEMELGVDGTWVELGVCTALFSKELIEKGDPKKLIMVDLWGDIDIYSDVVASDNFLQTIDRISPYSSRVEIWRMLTTEAADLVPDGSISFIYVDASHQYTDVLADVTSWWPKLRLGGVIAGDDYYNGYVPLAGNTFGVKDAVDEFAAKKNHRVYSSGYGDDRLGKHPQWYIFKCAE